MSSRNATGWMWAEACELLDQADRMHRQFFRLAASARSRAVWEPPVDVFEDEREVVIVVALPGVAEQGVELTLEAGVLVVRADSASRKNCRCMRSAWSSTSQACAHIQPVALRVDISA